MRKTILLSALLLAGCDRWRCHSGHYAVEYLPSHTSIYTQTHHVGKISYTTVHPIYHPATCSVTWYCDVRCSAVDEQQPEAHPKHQVYVTSPYVNPQCWFNGVQARVKP